MAKFKLNNTQFQILVWLFFYGMFYHPFYKEVDISFGVTSFGIYTLAFLLQLSLVWFNGAVLVPRLLGKDRYVWYIVSMLVSVIVFAKVLYMSTIGLLTTFDVPFGSDKGAEGILGYFAVLNLMFIGLSQLFHYQKNWHQMRERVIENEKEKVNAELSALKAQINPHLLFNSLNNIYSLSLDKSDKTPEMVLKLSDLISYVLYDCKGNAVPLDSEKKFLENYIALEKMRFGESVNIDYSFETCSVDISLAPLLFLPFVENAFKHVSYKDGEEPFISIKITCDGNGNPVFTSENSVSANEDIDVSPYSGIGIENVKKRLEYLYAGKYDLQIKKTEKVYSVKLTLCIQ